MGAIHLCHPLKLYKKKSNLFKLLKWICCLLLQASFLSHCLLYLLAELRMYPESSFLAILCHFFSFLISKTAKLKMSSKLGHLCTISNFYIKRKNVTSFLFCLFVILCVKSWISNKAWLVLVGGIVFLVEVSIEKCVSSVSCMHSLCNTYRKKEHHAYRTDFNIFYKESRKTLFMCASYYPIDRYIENRVV